MIVSFQCVGFDARRWWRWSRKLECVWCRNYCFRLMNNTCMSLFLHFWLCQLHYSSMLVYKFLRASKSVGLNRIAKFGYLISTIIGWWFMVFNATFNNSSLRNACTKSGSLRFSVFRLLTDFVCLYTYDFDFPFERLFGVR
jgi:hypothetical protein